MTQEQKSAEQFDEKAARKYAGSEVMLHEATGCWEDELVEMARWQFAQSAQRIAELEADRDRWKSIAMELKEALEKISNHKMNSVDKVYLILQCEGFQQVAREALAKANERMKE